MATRTARRSTTKASKVFSEDEKAAMVDRAAEVKGGEGDGEAAVREKLAEMTPADRAIGERLHAIIRAAAPGLTPRLWYGMPAYAKDGKLVCHFQPAKKFKTRYATLGFSDSSKLDDGAVWPVAYAVTKLTSADEAKIRALVKKAVD